MSHDFMGKRVFLSGPITSDPDYHRKFAEAERRVTAMGARDVWNPAANLLDGGLPHEHYMLRCLHELTYYADPRPGAGAANRPHYDVVALLPGWAASKGARDEALVARACGIEVVEL